jgi:hypothetical protein
MNPKRTGGNGSGKFVVVNEDMGGWIRFRATGQDIPRDLPVYLEQSVAEWFRKRPEHRMRCVVPIQREGDTVELHVWYETHVFPLKQGPRPEVEKPT